jgi:hypothetical protein
MNYKDTKPYMTAFLSVDLLTPTPAGQASQDLADPGRHQGRKRTLRHSV